MKKFLLILLAIFIVAQFIRPAKAVPAADPSRDLIAMTQPSAEVQQLLRVACYDCHSDRTRFPWYYSIAPVNWWMQDHINDACRHFNASEWGEGPNWKRDHQASESAEMMEKKEMPIDSYKWMHADARLTDAQYTLLHQYFQSLEDGSWQVEKAHRKAAGEDVGQGTIDNGPSGKPDAIQTGMAVSSCSRASVMRTSAKSPIRR